MKITVYFDHNGILRYNPDGWPKEPLKSTGFNSHAGFVHMGGDFGHEKTVKKYNAALEKAKSESVPFENQKITAEWAHIKPDSFYDVEIEGVIEIADQICQYKGENECYTRKAARIIPMYKQLSYKEQEYKEMIDTIKLLSTEEGIEYLKKILS